MVIQCLLNQEKLRIGSKFFVVKAELFEYQVGSGQRLDGNVVGLRDAAENEGTE